MAQSANVQSIAALKAFRSSLIKFAEAVDLSLAEADAELEWTLTYLKSDRYRFWKAQVFACREKATEARLALKRRRIFERAVQGTPSSCIDEIKALKKAERRLEIAERTYKRLRHWLVELDLEKTRFKGANQKMRETAEGRIPRAITQLDRWVDALESYIHLAPPTAGPANLTPEPQGNPLEASPMVRQNELQSDSDPSDPNDMDTDSPPETTQEETP